ncbi:MAG TPA: energy transducer TonB [Candidatus Sulfotelmatobacter sp.]|nr:energy transducer TonB [Candidatus Sulfotelmatobacter sp.]
MRKRLAVLLMLLLIGAGLAPSPIADAGPGGKPEVYNHVTAAGAALDRLVHQTYDSKWQVIDISDRDGTYTPPRLQVGPPPRPVLDAKGAAIQGKVMAFFIIAQDGHVQDPVIVQASDPRLGPAVFTTVVGWVFEPARFNGRIVAVTGGEEFDFAP